MMIYGDLIVNSHLKFTDASITVHGETIVAPGGSINVDPSILILNDNLTIFGDFNLTDDSILKMNSTGDGDMSIEVDAGGLLFVRDSTIMNSVVEDARYEFNVCVGGDFGRGTGIYIEADGTIINNTDIFSDWNGVIYSGGFSNVLDNSEIYASRREVYIRLCFE